MVVEPKGFASFPCPTFRPRMHFEAGVEKIGSRAEIVLQKCIFLVSLEFCTAKVQSGKMKACVQSFKYKGFTIFDKLRTDPADNASTSRGNARPKV